MQSKDKVQEAIVNRLQTKSGLDLKSLDVTTTSVSFDKNLAYATVAFHPKNDPAINSGMVMKYTLEQRDGKWVVLSVGDSQGRNLPGHSLQGHDLSNHGSARADLPPGHPALPGGGEKLGHPGPGSTGSEGANGQAR
jgi:hypothetical protein